MVKNILITIGVLSIILFLVLLVIGVKIVSTVFMYILGTVAAIALAGFIIYYIGKFAGKSSSSSNE